MKGKLFSLIVIFTIMFFSVSRAEKNTQNEEKAYIANAGLYMGEMIVRKTIEKEFKGIERKRKLDSLDRMCNIKREELYRELEKPCADMCRLMNDYYNELYLSSQYSEHASDPFYSTETYNIKNLYEKGNFSAQLDSINKTLNSIKAIKTHSVDNVRKIITKVEMQESKSMFIRGFLSRMRKKMDEEVASFKILQPMLNYVAICGTIIRYLEKNHKKWDFPDEVITFKDIKKQTEVDSLINEMYYLEITFNITFQNKSLDLKTEREKYSSQIVSGLQNTYDEQKVPEGAKEIKYKSGELELKAWISKDIDKKTKKPAVVFLHGGFNLATSDWDIAEEYEKAGFVVLMPMLRWENGNNGDFEMFGGEVDDAIAAGNYLADQDFVDKDKIFVSGHSVGGSMAIMTTLLASPFKKAVSIGGYPILNQWIYAQSDYITFDQENQKEFDLRNPVLYSDNIKIPLFLVAETDGGEILMINKIFFELCNKSGKCSFEAIEGDHHSIIDEAIKKSIEIFNSI